jgi:putative copper resistance protein D
MRVLTATVLVNLGLAGMIGAWACALWLRWADSPWATIAMRRSRTALILALMLTALADGLLLWMQAAYMGDMNLLDTLARLPSMLTTTYVGHAWSGGVVGLALVGGATSLAAVRRRAARPVVFVLGASLYVYCRAAVSHAGDFGLASPELLIESVHLWAISLWLGWVGFAPSDVLSQPAPESPLERCDVADWIGGLSVAATGALVVIVLSGVFNAWRGIGSVANLGSAYGNTLLLKVVLVAIAVGLRGINRFRVMPRLLAALRTPKAPTERVQRRFMQILQMEALVLLAARARSRCRPQLESIATSGVTPNNQLQELT